METDDRDTEDMGLDEGVAAPAPEPPPPEEEPGAAAVDLADPGVYVCVHENAGEHPVLGLLEAGAEYDYTQERDPHVLAAVAACVQSGLLEKQA